MGDRAEHAVGPRSGTAGRSGRRLSRSAEFERVYRQGHATANRHLVVYTFPNPSTRHPRLGLSVSRKVGGAVERNHVKRLLREAWAAVEDELVRDQDVVVVARPEARNLAEREGLRGIGASLGELIERAGLRAANAGSAPLHTESRAQASQEVGEDDCADGLADDGGPTQTIAPAGTSTRGRESRGSEG